MPSIKEAINHCNVKQYYRIPKLLTYKTSHNCFNETEKRNVMKQMKHTLLLT